jgi:predicted cobalt transporter CbtA
MSDQQPSSQQPQPPPEMQKWFEEIRREDAQRAHANIEEFRRSVNEAAIKTGELALRTAILINGGAAIALLGFVGSLPKEHKAAFASTLIWFAAGVALGALGIGLAYFTNYLTAGVATSMIRSWDHPYIQESPKSRLYRIAKMVVHVAAVTVALASLVTFIVGMIEVRDAIAAIS